MVWHTLDMRKLFSVLLGAACLTGLSFMSGCSPADQTQEPTQPIIATSNTVITRDLGCGQLTPSTKQKIIDTWGFSDITQQELVGAQVKIGDGLEKGHEWWVVTYQLPRAESAPYSPSYYITDAPGRPDHLTWIEVWLVGGHLTDWNGSLAWTGNLRERGSAALLLAASCPWA